MATLNKQDAREAGWWYLSMLVTGPIGIMYVPSQIIQYGDPSLTVQNILHHDTLYRIGILASVLCQIANIFLAASLVRYFAGIEEKFSKWLMSLVLVMVPIAIVNELNSVMPLVVLGKSAFEATTSEQIVMSFLQLHGMGIRLVSIFWGLWLLPFGLLALRSNHVPALLGWLLVGGCWAYVLTSTVGLVMPAWLGSWSSLIMLIPTVAEVGMVGWLLYDGYRRK